MGNIIHLPMIEIRGIPLDIDQFATLIDPYQIILLTSRYAVEHFIGKAIEDSECLKQLKTKDIVVIGKDTADATDTI